MNETRTNLFYRLIEVREYFRTYNKVAVLPPLWFKDVLRGVEETDEQYLVHINNCIRILKEGLLWK